MFEHIEKDVGRAMFASMVRGIILYHTNHLKLLVTYGEIATALKTLPGGGQMSQALALITENDARNKRPLSTAIVVNSQTKRPGKGFFDQCQALGVKFTSPEDFWQDQIKKLGVAEFYLSELDKIESRPDTELDSLGRSVVAKVSEAKERGQTWTFKTPTDFGKYDVSQGIGPKLAWLIEASTVEPTLPQPIDLHTELPLSALSFKEEEPEAPVTASGLPT